MENTLRINWEGLLRKNVVKGEDGIGKGFLENRWGFFEVTWGLKVFRMVSNMENVEWKKKLDTITIISEIALFIYSLVRFCKNKGYR